MFNATATDSQNVYVVSNRVQTLLYFVGYFLRQTGSYFSTMSLRQNNNLLFVLYFVDCKSAVCCHQLGCLGVLTLELLKYKLLFVKFVMSLSLFVKFVFKVNLLI